MGKAGLRHHGVDADTVEPVLAKELRCGLDDPLAVRGGLCF
jgi:hypothetical protein